jgi:pyruvate/2-oxoglutarate dehydrogenase complex dihydrolipoamide acyltransferase (E2) component
MEHPVRMPKLSLTMEEGEVLEWHVAVGGQVAEEGDLVTVAAEKADVVIPSPYTGRVTAIQAAPGDVVVVGEIICTVED